MSAFKYLLLSFPITSFGLGVWQIKRLDWKKGIIADLEARLKEEPIDLLSITSAQDLQTLEYRRVKARGHYDPDPSHQIYLKPRALFVNEEAILRNKTAHQQNNGVNVVTPFTLDGTNLRILVNRGWLADKGRDSLTNSAHLGLKSKDGTDTTIDLVGIIRQTDNRSTYGLHNDITTNTWHIRDIPAMAKALKTAPIFLDAVEDLNRREGPLGGQTQLQVRNEHLNYAITWFSLSALSTLMWFMRYGTKKYKFQPIR